MSEMNNIIKITAVMLACMMFGFMQPVQAQPTSAPASFDHTKTGFILKDIHTTLRCEQCHVDAIFKNTPKECSGCHSIGSRVGATPKPVNHVQTTNACDTCHVSATSFLVKSFKHVGISSGCASCHNGQSLGVVSKSASHFPTLLPCENCHTNTNTFASWKMDHTGITSGCANCHGAQFASVVSKPAMHITIPAGVGCETCHTKTNTNNYTTFLGAVFDHTGATAASCATCHSGSYPGVLSKPAMHIAIPAGAGCGTCHTQANTANYTTFLGAVYNHAGVVAGSCSSCHNGSYPGVLGKPVSHIPSAAACDACHTQANTNNFMTFKNALYDHTTASGVCSTCHSGSFAGVTGKAANHLATTAQCDTCHTQSASQNYTSWLGAVYNHAGAAGICSTCHNGSVVGVLGKPATHMPTTAQCDTCHSQTNTNNYVSFLGAVYNHTTPLAAGLCSTCHTGAYTNVQGKLSTHISTTAQCDTCHTQTLTQNYTTFLGATYTHPNPPGVCSTCHNGVQAKGKPVVHITTTQACDQCHTQTNTSNYTTFLGVANPHKTTTVTGVCSTCHNNTQAVGQPPNHIPTGGQTCDVCHTATNTGNYSSFLGALYNHSGVVAGSCGNCHNGSYPGVLGKPVTHVTTTAACDTCHTAANTSNYLNFLGATYNHTGVVAGSCATCHNGVQAKGKPTTHIATTLACDLCHTSANTGNFTSFLGAPNPHTVALFNVGLTGICATCHNGTQATGKPATHLTTTAACDSCHSNTSNYTTWLGAIYSHTGVAAGSCATCHNGIQAMGKPATHMLTTASCDICHTATNTSNYVTFLGAAVAHDATMAGRCANAGCHDGAAAKGKSVGHVPVSLSCDSGGCHAMYNGSSVLNFTSGTLVHSVVTTSLCGGCHNGAYTSQGVFGAVAQVSNHIPTTITGALDCNTCHKGTPPNTKPTAGAAAWATGEKMNHNGAQGGGVPIYCVTCHLTGNTYLGVMQKKAHNGTSTAKDCSKSSCHKPLGSIGTVYNSWN